MDRPSDPKASARPGGSKGAAQGPKSPTQKLASGFAKKPGSPLSPRVIELVQASWADVRPISDAAATLFYDRLFQLDPTVQPLFKNDMAEQKKKLMATLGVAVEGLRNLDKLVPALEDLGIRHAGYMVQPHHYDLVGQALLWTLEEGLGEAFTAEVKGAWTAVYTVVAGVMKKAAARASGASEHPPNTLIGLSSEFREAAMPRSPAELAAGANVEMRPVTTAGPAPAPSRRDTTPHPRVVPRKSLAAQPNRQPAGRSVVDLVQSSWAMVRPISDAAATLFYERLFELDPSVRSLFKDDMSEQKKKLMQTLNVAVEGLRNKDKLVPVLEDLGIRHAGYMVQDHHYDAVGQALLWTLAEGLGDEFTSEVKAAWTETYELIAGIMKEAAARHGNHGFDGPQTSQTARLSNPPANRPAGPASPPPTPLRRRATGTPAPAAPAPARDPGSAPLDARTVALVQGSWQKVRPISDAAAALFYDRLFELDPSVRPLFKPDMSAQKTKLMQTLEVAVKGLSNPKKLIPVLEDLGARHAGYMVQEHHYDLVGQALLWTLKEGLGDELTPETHAAWTAVYGFIARVMKGAAAARGQETGQEASPPASRPGKSGAPAARVIELVQGSWNQVRPISDAAATLFYDRLFELDPSVRPLFKDDMGEQKKKLMQTLEVAVTGLRNPDKLVPILEGLGVRHAGYMVQEHHYDLVGQALLWTLQEGLGDSFTSEVKEAWIAVYAFIAGVMKEAAEASASAGSEAAGPPGAARAQPAAARSFVQPAAAQPAAQPAAGQPAARAPIAASPAPPRAAAMPADTPIQLALPAGLVTEDGAIAVRLDAEQLATLSAGRAPGAVGQTPRGSLGMAILLAIICGSTIFAVSSVLLLFGASNWSSVAANLPVAVLIAPPIAATVLTIAAFLLGYFWGRPHPPDDGSPGPERGTG